MQENNIEDPRFLRFKIILKDLRIIFRAIQAHSRLVEKESGVSSAQLWMMWEIFNTPGMKVSELAKVLSLHQSTCSNMLDKIEEKGLVSRDRSTTDQRIVRLFLTEKGTKLLAAAPRPAQGALTQALFKLPDKTLDNLEQGLTELVRALKIPDVDEEASMTPITER